MSIRPAVLCLATFLVGCSLPLLPGIRQLEDRSEDLRFRWRGVRKSDARVVTVLIDATAEQTWQEPRAFWGARIAEVVRKCDQLGARRIGIDMIVTPNVDSFLIDLYGRWQAEALGQAAPLNEEVESKLILPNAELEDAISKANGKVVLATMSGNDSDFNIERAAAPNLGYAGIERGSREVVREMPGGRHLGQAWLPSFAWKMADRNPPSRESIRINYSGLEPQTVGAIDLLSERFESDIIRDAYVIIGEQHRAVQDLHDTPFASLTPGVAIQAETLRTILDDAALERVPLIAASLVCGLIGAASFAIAWKFSLGQFLAAVTGFVVIWVAAAQVSFGQNVVLPLAAPLLLAAVAAPVLAFPEKAVRNELRFRQQRAQFGQMISESMVVRLEKRTALGMGTLENIQAALLFMDIEEFSDKSNRLSSEEVLTSLNLLLEIAIRAVEDFGGYVLAFTGDGFSAVFEARPDHDPRPAAVDSAEALVDRIVAWNSERPDSDPWNVRVGLAFGDVSIALVGSGGRFTISTYGPAVNLASRLEQAGKLKGKRLIVSSDFADVVSDKYTNIPLTLKGFGDYSAFTRE